MYSVVISLIDGARNNCGGTNSNIKSKDHQSESNRKSKTDGYQFSNPNQANIKVSTKLNSIIETSPNIIGIVRRIKDGPTGPLVMCFFIDFSVLELAEGEDVNKTRKCNDWENSA